MKNAVISHYEGYDESQREFGTKSEQLEFLYTKKLIEQYLTSSMSVLEIGCGAGYYGLHLADKCRLFHGVDLSPRNIEKFDAKITERKLKNIIVTVGDATDLNEINDNSFDIVLNFGPMYHLPQNERQKAMLESKRVCKDGGIILFAYINKIGVYLRAGFDDKLKLEYPNLETNKYVLEKGIDISLPDVFYYTMPEEIEGNAKEIGLSVVKNAGVDFAFTSSEINAAEGQRYSAWIEILDYMFESASCIGTSNHAVLVCRK